MTRWEYRVLPAPRRGAKVKGAKTAEDRFAAALAEVMNEQGAEGWDYVRSDSLPVEERQGLTGKVTTWQHLLVFRRPLAEVSAVARPDAAPPVPAPAPIAASRQEPAPTSLPPGPAAPRDPG